MVEEIKTTKQDKPIKPPRQFICNKADICPSKYGCEHRKPHKRKRHCFSTCDEDKLGTASCIVYKRNPYRLFQITLKNTCTICHWTHRIFTVDGVLYLYRDYEQLVKYDKGEWVSFYRRTEKGVK